MPDIRWTLFLLLFTACPKAPPEPLSAAAPAPETEAVPAAPAASTPIERKVQIQDWSAEQVHDWLVAHGHSGLDPKKTRAVQFYVTTDPKLIARSRWTSDDNYTVTVKGRGASDEQLERVETTSGLPRQVEIDETWDRAMVDRTESTSFEPADTKDPLPTLTKEELGGVLATTFPEVCDETPCRPLCGEVTERRWKDKTVTLSEWSRDGGTVVELSSRDLDAEAWKALLDELFAAPSPPGPSPGQSKTAWAIGCGP